MAFPLITERLSISPLGVSDLDSFVEYRKDPLIARYQSWEPSFSKEQGFELIKSQSGVEMPEKGHWLQLAMHQRGTDVLIGDLALHSIEGSDAEFELGFTVARKYQRQGFAKEATTKLLEHLFSELAAVRVIATPDARNLPSIGLLTALGFEKRPEKTWSESFKGETVTVDFYQLELIRENS